MLCAEVASMPRSTPPSRPPGFGGGTSCQDLPFQWNASGVCSIVMQLVTPPTAQTFVADMAFTDRSMSPGLQPCTGALNTFHALPFQCSISEWLIDASEK